MLWAIRILVALYLLVPFVGSFVGTSVSTYSIFDIPAESWTLILHTLMFSIGMAALALIFVVLLAPFFLNRDGEKRLKFIVIVLTATFFIPATLKVHSFHQVWGAVVSQELRDYVLFLLWMVSYNTVFLLAALMISITKRRSQIDNISELMNWFGQVKEFWRMSWSYLSISFVCVVVLTFFGGIEFSRLTTNIYSPGRVLTDLYYVNDDQAATLAAAILFIGLIVSSVSYKTWFKS